MTENFPLISSFPVNYFPSDVLKWMKINAKPRMSLKLMQICKYFQHQKFPFSHLKYVNWNYEDGLSFNVNNKHFYGYSNLPNNLWFTGKLEYSWGPPLSDFLRKVIVCDIRELELSRQDNITYDEFKCLTANGTIIECTLYATPIKYDNNELLSFEAILGHLPNVENIVICKEIPPWQSKDAKINFPKLKWVHLMWLNEIFNFEGFVNFMINNQKTNFYVEFHKTKMPATYVQMVVKCINKIVKEWKAEESKPPLIEFKGQGKKAEKVLAKLQKFRESYDQKMKELKTKE